MPRLLLSLSTLIILAWASKASAQLTAAKDGPIVYGHHHLNTTNMEAQRKFFVETLGGTLVKDRHRQHGSRRSSRTC